MCLKKNMKFISLADVNFIFFSLFFQLNRVGIKRLKTLKRATLMSNSQKCFSTKRAFGGKEELNWDYPEKWIQ